MNEFLIKINLLNDIINKKIELLSQAFNITENQQLILKQIEDDNYTNIFNNMVKEKQAIIENIVQSDDIFNKIYSEISEEINTNSCKYKDELNLLKDKIKLSMDFDIKIRTKEERNKRLSMEKKVTSPQIKTLKTSKNYLLNQYAKNTKKKDINS